MDIESISNVNPKDNTNDVFWLEKWWLSRYLILVGAQQNHTLHGYVWLFGSNAQLKLANSVFI